MNSRLFPLLGALTLALTSTLAIGDDDRHEHNESHEEASRWLRGWRSDGIDFAPVTDQTYRNECGSCHFAYQPGLLPTRSWQAVMNGLADHFGDNAELENTTAAEILDYLSSNAADSANAPGRAAGVARGIPADALPLRITQTSYFQRKHHELSARFVRDNPQVGSFSACSACHTGADKGSYNEHQVQIPGVGRWED